MPDFHVQCLEPVTYHGGDEGLPFTVDDKPRGVTLRIGGFNRRLMAGLPDRVLDLLEIAALVYGVDSAVSRGGTTDRKMGEAWYRRFWVEMPVRDPDLWNTPAIKDALEETLLFLSDDQFEFTFFPGQHARMESKWFDFGKDEGWQADRVLMFSGGLDSFAGPLEEVIAQRNRVALVSHFSSTKIAPVQRHLCKAISDKEGPDTVRHFPMRIQLWKQSHQESTHRTRSFLFAVLGLLTTLAFNGTRVSFHENGVVSLNLPPVGSVVGARATKTTHPQTLTQFSRLFSHVFEREIRVDNPFFWRTKTDVLQTIHRLGMADQIRVSSSCADTHNRTRQHPHCGRCSQCIDRRFAVLAAGMAHHDPGEAYAMHLLEAPRTSAIDRELALSYLRNALAFDVMSPRDLEARFPGVLSAINHLDLSPEVALERISDLLRRHGAAVSETMREVFRARTVVDFPDGSLPRLFGDLQRAQSLGLPSIETSALSVKSETRLRLAIDRDGEIVVIGDAVTLKRTAAALLLIVLAEAHLEGLGKGLDPLDFPMLQAKVLARRFGYENEESVRRGISRTRSELRGKLTSAGFDEVLANGIIETSPWHGYRLAPDCVEVRVTQDA